MSPSKKPTFLYRFDALENPRIDKKKLYPLPEVLLVVLCAKSLAGGRFFIGFLYCSTFIKYAVNGLMVFE